MPSLQPHLMDLRFCPCTPKAASIISLSRSTRTLSRDLVTLIEEMDSSPQFRITNCAEARSAYFSLNPRIRTRSGVHAELQAIASQADCKGCCRSDRAALVRRD